MKFFNFLILLFVAFAAAAAAYYFSSARLDRAEETFNSKLDASRAEFSTRMADSEESLSRALDEQFEALSQLISSSVCSPEVTNRVSQSVYRVWFENEDGEELWSGTAWVADQENGVLATNAHVAEDFINPESDEEILGFAIAPNSSSVHQILGGRVHNARQKFAEDIEYFDPMLLNGESPFFPPILHGFDLALLFVDPSQELRQAIPLMSDEDVRALPTNTAVARIGYPTSYYYDYQQLSTTPQVQSGNIIAQKHFLQFGDNPAYFYALLHNVPSGPGSSGSPIINCAGEVVGVHSNRVGEYLQNAGQRVDLLRELLEQRDVAVTSQTHQPVWRAMLDDPEVEIYSAHQAIPIALSRKDDLNISDLEFAILPTRIEFKEGPVTVCLEEGVAGGDPTAADPFGATAESEAVRAEDTVCIDDIEYSGIWTGGSFTLEPDAYYLIYAFPNAVHPSANRSGYHCQIDAIRLRREGRTAFDDSSSSMKTFNGRRVAYAFFDTRAEADAQEVEVFLEFEGRDIDACNKNRHDFAIQKIFFEEGLEPPVELVSASFSDRVDSAVAYVRDKIRNITE